jgi:hypothetical protein
MVSNVTLPFNRKYAVTLPLTPIASSDPLGCAATSDVMQMSAVHCPLLCMYEEQVLRRHYYYQLASDVHRKCTTDCAVCASQGWSRQAHMGVWYEERAGLQCDELLRQLGSCACGWHTFVHH